MDRFVSGKKSSTLSGLSRRDFMGAALAVGLTVSAADQLYAQTAVMAPKRGGRLRMAVPGGASTDSLNPGTWNETFMQTVGFGPLRNNLAEISSDNEVIPELAESWEPSKDARTWTFKLRRGVEFHSGKSLTSSDVQASFNHHRDPATTSQAKGLVGGIKDIRVDGDSTVIFELNQGNADFPSLLTDYHLVILPSDKEGKANWLSGDGTGGYTIQNFEPGVRALLKRSGKYWKANAAHFDEIEVLAINDIAARQNALMTGDVDVADRIDLKTVNLLRRNPNIVIENVAGRLHYTFEMAIDSEPFADQNIRLAMKYAMNRQALLETVLRGFGIVGNDNPISPAYKYFDASLPQRTYDPDKAKFHLQKAGRSSLAVDLNVAEIAFNGATDACVLFKEHAAKAGIDINVVRAPNDGYFAKVWGKLPFAVSYYTGRPTEDGIFSLAYAKGATMNTSKWDNDRFNALLVAARAELDVSKRREMYSEMQRLTSEDGGFIVPLFGNYVFARSGKLAHGPKLSSDRSLDGAKMAERWWFA